LDCRWTCKVSRCRRGISSHGSCTCSTDCCSLSSTVGAGAPLRVQLVTGIGSNQHPQQWSPQHPHVHRRCHSGPGPVVAPPPGRPSRIPVIGGGGGGGGGGSAVSQRWPRKPAGQLHVNATVIAATIGDSAGAAIQTRCCYTWIRRRRRNRRYFAVGAGVRARANTIISATPHFRNRSPAPVHRVRMDWGGMRRLVAVEGLCPRSYRR
jgi:hypothetical protein